MTAATRSAAGLAVATLAGCNARGLAKEGRRRVAARRAGAHLLLAQGFIPTYKRAQAASSLRTESSIVRCAAEAGQSPGGLQGQEGAGPKTQALTPLFVGTRTEVPCGPLRPHHMRMGWAGEPDVSRENRRALEGLGRYYEVVWYAKKEQVSYIMYMLAVGGM